MSELAVQRATGLSQRSPAVATQQTQTPGEPGTRSSDLARCAQRSGEASASTADARFLLSRPLAGGLAGVGQLARVDWASMTIAEHPMGLGVGFVHPNAEFIAAGASEFDAAQSVDVAEIILSERRYDRLNPPSIFRTTSRRRRQSARPQSRGIEIQHTRREYSAVV